jgi:hypothetical protein
MEVLRKYGTATTILFPLVTKDAQDYLTTASHASGDTKISKDEGDFANTTNGFAHAGNGVYSLALTATEMQAARVVVTIIDQGTKAWEDQAVLISTYGGSSAQHLLSAIADHVLRRSWASAASSSDGDTKAFRSLLGAVAKLVNKISVGSGTLTICEADDSTSLGTQTVSSSSSADAITGLDTD